MSTGAWVPLSRRPEWANTHPVEPADGAAAPVVQIAYSERFKEIKAYLRCVRSRGEVSPRALALTTESLADNGADYSVWALRRDLLARLALTAPACLEEELAWLEGQVTETPKNYQLWNHRRWLAEQFSSRGGVPELAFTSAVLASSDDKNYHAWAHRQWALRRFNMGADKGEPAFATRLLARDVRNNSAWNQRAAPPVPSGLGGGSDELAFVLRRLSSAPDNEACWSVLRSLLQRRPEGWRPATRLATAILKFAPACLPALTFVADASIRLGRLDAALRLFFALRALDPMRARFWTLHAALCL